MATAAANPVPSEHTSLGGEDAAKSTKAYHTTAVIATATHPDDDDHRGDPSPGGMIPLQTLSAANTTAPREGAGSAATTAPATIEGIPSGATNEDTTLTNPTVSDGADGNKDKTAAAGEERDIGDGCQSSAERNIWSVFNPIWNTFIVKKARLPNPGDRGADWAGNAGRPTDLGMFLGLKNPVNRK